MTQSPPSLTRRELLVSAVGASALAASGTVAGQSLPGMPAITKELWEWVRTQPVLDLRQSYLDTAGAGPTWRAAMAAEYRAREIQSQSVAILTNGQWTTETQRLAARFAKFLGCDIDELLFTHGAGEAIGTVAAGLDLAAGDEVVTTAREHPAALSPWLVLARRRGIVVKQVELPSPLQDPAHVLERFTAAITERTKVLAFSHLQYCDGAVLPVRELCQLARQRSIMTVVDGAQTIGMLDFAIRDLGCDFYATCFHKWLGGSHGTGALIVRREMLDRLWPLEPRGIDASPPVATPTESAGHDGAPAALHKLGNIVPQIWPALRGAEVASEFQLQVLRNRIEARVRELAIYARLRLQPVPGVEILTPVRPGSWAGILSFRVAGRAASEIAARLARIRIYVRDLQWPNSTDGALRASLHVFNSHDDIDKLAQGLEQAIR
jgi:isopenicillin-N epimerase